MVLYADLVSADQVPHTPQAGCWAGPTIPLLFYFFAFSFFLFHFPFYVF
jgi:hypothetical protein